MELPDVKGNSIVDRNKSIPEAKPIELKGNAEVKKKTIGEKLISAFLPEDIEATKRSIMKDIVIPAIKQAALDSISEWLGFNISPRSRSGSPLDRPSYSYDKVRNRNDRSRAASEPARQRDDFDYRQIYFEYESDAKAVLEQMESILDRYPWVTIGHLYDILDRRTTPSLFDFGWETLRDATITRERGGGVTLNLPKATSLN